jgi:hypothetical protein
LASGAMSDPEAARRKALEKLQGIAEMDDPEGVVVPILLDAILLVESTAAPATRSLSSTI